MTPDLFEQGAERLESHEVKISTDVSSGDRGASYGRVHTSGELDTTHGRILYLEMSM
jgi:urea transport system ATP-binding protein